MKRPAAPTRTRGPALPASVLLVVATFVVAAALAYKFYQVTESEQAMASRTRSAYAAFAAAELSRETTRLMDDEARRILLPVRVAYASADRPPISPDLLLATAVGTAGPSDGVGLLQPWMAFRLEVATGTLTIAATAGAAEDTVVVAGWLPEFVADELAHRRASGQSEHGVRVVPADGTLLTMSTVPDAVGRVWLVYGLVSDADRVVSGMAAHVMDHHTLLPLAPLGGTQNREALRLSLHAPGGRSVYRNEGGMLAGMHPVELAMSGPLARYTVRSSLAPGFAVELADASWTWSQAHLAIILLVLCAGLIVMAMWQIRRDRALTQLRGDFVASVSHELRTPLAQIRMFAEMLRLGWIRTDEERERAVVVIDHESRRLTNLVENVLQFSGREHPPRRILAQPLGTVELLEEVVHGFDVLLEPHGTRIRLDVEPGLVVHADEDALRQVLLNLLDNALKYGPAGQVVTIGGEAAGEAGVRLWVEDEGPGIPPSDRRSVFEPYRRRRRDVDAGITGSGIGLTVVRDLVHAHGGAIWVEGARPHGARVVFTLPTPSPIGAHTEEGGAAAAPAAAARQPAVAYHPAQAPSS